MIGFELRLAGQAVANDARSRSPAVLHLRAVVLDGCELGIMALEVGERDSRQAGQSEPLEQRVRAVVHAEHAESCVRLDRSERSVQCKASRQVVDVEERAELGGHAGPKTNRCPCRSRAAGRPLLRARLRACASSSSTRAIRRSSRATTPSDPSSLSRLRRPVACADGSVLRHERCVLALPRRARARSARGRRQLRAAAAGVGEGARASLDRDDSDALEDSSLVLAQAEDFRPDVVYVQDLNALSPRLLRALRGRCRILVGQIASKAPPPRQLEPFDLILTSFPHFVPRFREQGIASEYFRIGFDPRVLTHPQTCARC